MRIYVTFGSGHYPWGHHYSYVEAESHAQARAQIVDAIAGRWSTTYDRIEDLQLDKYPVKYIPWEEIVANPPTSTHGHEGPPTQEEKERCRIG